jgi:pimeloyl-ACP methyl ester carboxylesterase
MTRLYLLPGLLCDAAIWQPQIAALSSHADVRVPDLTGLASIPAMAAYVLRDAPQQFAVAGHSMGARVALEMFRQAPDRVTRIALLDTGVHPVAPGEPEQRRRMTDLSRLQGMRALADAWLPPMVAPANFHGELKSSLYAMVERMTPEIHRRHIQALLNRPDARPLLGAIRMPTLVGVGSEDGWSTPEQNRAIANAIAGARFLTFGDSGHMAPLEAAGAVTAALEEWLA